MSTIPITTLTPNEAPPKDKAIRGVVTLFWPYSSSTRQCALLLADPDFRLRNKRGQVRIRFTGASAEAVAKSHVGIGDEVVLRLDGASWEEDTEATRTPGKSVDGELFFRRRLQLTVTRDGEPVQVDVDAPASPPRSMGQDDAETVATPLPKAIGKLRSSLDGTVETLRGHAYPSPAFVKRVRLSSESLLDSTSDPFTGERMDVDDEDETDRRTSFGRNVIWRYAMKSPSPTKDTSTAIQEFEQGSFIPDQDDTEDNGTQQDDTAKQMPPPPPRPKLQLTSTTPPPFESASTMEAPDGPTTPKLHPVKSPSLPLPSPFPTEAISQPQVELPRGTSQSTHLLPEEVQDKAESPAETRSHTRAEPETPTKTSGPTGPDFGFGLDGATSTDMPPKEDSPQEAEKKKVMAQTYRSLFGFTTPSYRQDEVLDSNTITTPALSDIEKRRLDASKHVGTEEAEVERISTQQAPKPPAQSQEVEVVEIDSSSEHEHEDQEQPSTAQEFTPAEIPDTYQDSQAEDLLAAQYREDEAVSSALSQGSHAILQTEQTDDSMLESFIEPGILYPTLPPASVEHTTSEQEVNGRSLESYRSQSPELQHTQPADQSLQQPSYPSLPLTPSNSQSIQDVAPQAIFEIPETLTSMLPPTPQLTQAGSSATQLQALLPPGPSSQEQPSQTIDEPQEQAVEDRMSLPTIRSERKEPEQAAMPDSQELDQLQPEAPAPSTEQIEIGRTTRARAKKAAAGRVSNIPDAISSYFSPKRCGGVVPPGKETDAPATTSEALTNGHVADETKPQPPANGFSTALSYFTPLSRLDSLLNPSSSQQTFGLVNTVEIFAVVTESTTEPARAKAGPRDYYTILRITDSSLSPQSTRVEVFRPFKNTLPTAKAGDVMLLRAFAVKSRQRQPYLISSDASAWCVFSYRFNKAKPAYALNMGEANNEGLSETASGPPVEYGEEEQEHAKALAEWWLTRCNETQEIGAHDHDDVDETNGMKGHVTQAVAAKL